MPCQGRQEKCCQNLRSRKEDNVQHQALTAGGCDGYPGGPAQSEQQPNLEAIKALGTGQVGLLRLKTRQGSQARADPRVSREIVDR